MQLYQIRYFLAVSETLNFTRAAELCNVSQPALTKAIQRLEEEMGAELIRREGRRSHLTTAGKLLRHELIKVETGLSDAVNTVKRSLSLQSTNLNVAIMCSIGPHKYAELFKKFKELQPGIKLVLTDVTQMALSDSLLEGRVDCAIYAGEAPIDHERLDAVTLHEERMVVAFQPGHAFSQLAAVPMADAARQPYIDRLHCEFRPRIIQFIQENKIDFQAAYCSEREDWIQAMIASGNGVCILPEFILNRTDIEYRPVSEPIQNRVVQLVYVRGRDIMPAQREFQDFVIRNRPAV